MFDFIFEETSDLEINFGIFRVQFRPSIERYLAHHECANLRKRNGLQSELISLDVKDTHLLSYGFPRSQ
jgi:hypothetical protein